MSSLSKSFFHYYLAGLSNQVFRIIQRKSKLQLKYHLRSL
jgi:hypothetical protein